VVEEAQLEAVAVARLRLAVAGTRRVSYKCKRSWASSVRGPGSQAPRHQNYCFHILLKSKLLHPQPSKHVQCSRARTWRVHLVLLTLKTPKP
jgi:hypothetical protein